MLAAADVAILTISCENGSTLHAEVSRAEWPSLWHPTSSAGLTAWVRASGYARLLALSAHREDLNAAGALCARLGDGWAVVCCDDSGPVWLGKVKVELQQQGPPVTAAQPDATLTTAT